MSGWLAREAWMVRYRALSALLHEYEWIHRVLGIFGHFCFFAGSVLFLWEGLKTAGVWLFIVGAGGMLIDRICSLIVAYERRRRTG